MGQLADAINHMRQFGRKGDQQLSCIQINQVLAGTLDFFSQQLKVRGIEVVCRLQDNLPPVMADADRLEQVFINLLINARDAIEARWPGPAAQKGDRRITLQTGLAGANVRIEVRDTGAGVDAEILDKIFEPFFTTKQVGKGTGLGLSISYRIIHDFGGRIEAVADQDSGACFVIYLPAAGQSTGEAMRRPAGGSI